LVPENKCPVFSEKQRRIGLMFSQSRKEEMSAADAQTLLRELKKHQMEK